MLERYYLRPETLDRIHASWIATPIERYVAWLTEEHYAARNVFRRVPILRQFGEFARAQGATTWDHLPQHVDAFVGHWVRTRGREGERAAARQKRIHETRNPIAQMLRLLGLSVPGPSRRRDAPEPFQGQAGAFFTALREERGLRPASIAHYRYHLGHFEAYLQRLGLVDLAALSPVVLGAFVAESSQRLRRTGLRDCCGTLRVFLRYLYRERRLAADLSVHVESPHRYRLATLPRAIAWDDVRRLLASIDRRTAVGKRDYAILLLLVTYGLRAREVAALTLDDIDWRRDRLQVLERKAEHATAYPLSPIVGAAVLDYLQHARPQTSERPLFFRTLAPRRPLTPAAVSSRAAYYLHRIGVPVPRPGSHTLRHTCVQRLVEAGLPFPVVGEYVGHRTPASTEIYAKVATEALREVALGDGEAIL